MAEMNEFEDLEALLLRHGLAEPPADIGEALVKAGASLLATEQRRRSRRLSAAAVAVVVALNLAAERYISTHTAAETHWLTPATAVRDYPDLVSALNGFAAQWPRWQALLSIRPRTPRLRPTAPADLLKELER
jgi:hypothetical protein